MKIVKLFADNPIAINNNQRFTLSTKANCANKSSSNNSLLYIQRSSKIHILTCCLYRSYTEFLIGHRLMLWPSPPQSDTSTAHIHRNTHCGLRKRWSFTFNNDAITCGWSSQAAQVRNLDDFSRHSFDYTWCAKAICNLYMQPHKFIPTLIYEHRRNLIQMHPNVHTVMAIWLKIHQHHHPRTFI